VSASNLVDHLSCLACLAEIRGTADAADLRTAVSRLIGLTPGEAERLEQRIRHAESPQIPDLPAAAVWRLRELASGSGEAALRARRAGIPTLLRWLLELTAVTHEQAAALARDLGVVTLSDLLTALADGRVHRLMEPAAARLKASADVLSREVRSVSLGRAVEILTAVQTQIAHHCPQVEDVVMAGGARRFEPLVPQLMLVARATDPAIAVEALCAMPDLDDILHRTLRRVVLWVHHHEVDVRIAAPDEFGTVLFNSTGAGPHVAAVAARLRSAPHAREEDVYAQAGLPFIAPEMRSGTGEIEAAAAGRLPQLVRRLDIRGDLHMHSTYSDGQDTLEAMVAASAALGYEYIAITDHSQSAAASRTVTRDQLARQRDEILRLRNRYPGIAILHGIEVDILPDGRLDFPDAVLAQLDLVLASLHDAARQDGPTLTRRCLRAIAHPLVNVITHPANRLVGRRPGYPLDFEAIYAAAAETGTALEVDGAPSHLDMDGEHARAAVAAGVTVTIDSDCHRVRALDHQMRLGIGTARRGWVEARNVLNCRSLTDVRAFVEAKRRR
jgi:DNA polymerase (family 10)